jgi:fumarate reductase flavoprotein subunit
LPGIIRENSYDADIAVDCLIIGGGAAGLTAALAAKSRRLSVLVAERENRISGSTALSSGLIPAAGTTAQQRQGIKDRVKDFHDDIMAKNKHSADPRHVDRCVNTIAGTIDWLEEAHDIPFHVLDGFLYPGHRHHRMHAVPEVTGAALVYRLEKAATKQDILISCSLKVTDLVFTDDDHILGAKAERPDGTVETIAANAVILACNGYGGNPDLVAEHIPEMREALYFGHPGNQGEAVLWGQEIGAETRHLSGYQGHGSVAHPHGILVTWALMMEGGLQVNLEGRRFSNEHQGYSEQAVSVLAQPEKTAFNIFDERLCVLGREFEDFRMAEEAKAIIKADSIEELAQKLAINLEALKETLAECEEQAKSGQADRFGRNFDCDKTLSPPYAAVKVTGALFHTQGGLVINDNAEVVKKDGSVLKGLFACGGAACGVSGPDVSGYLSGNGLLTALSLGYIAGVSAAKVV